MKSKYGLVALCRYCGQDIEFTGRHTGWRDRGGNRACCPYIDKKAATIVKPKTKHTPPKA